MKRIFKSITIVIMSFIIMIMANTTIISNAALNNVGNNNDDLKTSYPLVLQGDDGNSSFHVVKYPSTIQVNLINLVGTNPYYSLRISFISSYGYVISSNTYSGYNSFYGTLLICPSDTDKIIVKAQLFVTPNNDLCISNWSAKIENISSSPTIRGSDGRSNIIVTRNGNYAYLTIKNITSSSHYISLNIDAMLSGNIIGNTPYNGVIVPDTTYTILNINNADSFNYTAQMWSNATPTGMKLSNWEANL